MDIRHHPDDEMLLAHASGRNEAGTRLVLSTHLELCGHCRERLRMLEAVGGAMLSGLAPAPVADDALERTWARIDRQHAGTPRRIDASPPPPLPLGATWPRALAHCHATPWRWIGPGLRWSRVSVPQASEANLFLLRVAPGKYLPRHTHTGLELTQILCGRFHDGRAMFGPGDFDAADAEIHHQPVVQEGSECICLASVDGKLQFDSVIAGFLGGLVGM